MSTNKNWAQSYLIDPLTAPDPSDETGPNAHFRSTFAPAESSHNQHHSKSPESTPAVSLREHTTGTSTSSTNPFRRRSGSVNNAYPSPPASASPRKDAFPTSYREEAFGSHNEPTGRPRRASSLKARYPGDKSHEPLAILRKDSKKAYRSPHLSKKHLPRADMIDRLDVQSYHHEGPYDAVLAVRNTSFENSPVAAVSHSNAEALKATPRENIQDSLERHRPLEGTATIPPGMADRFGRTYEYEEGTDMMRDAVGNYKRWPGQQYHPDDLKGKGEPSYSIEKALKDHKHYGDEGIEMKSQRSRNKSLGHMDRDAALDNQEASGVSRSNTTGRRVSEGLKKRFGSLRRRKDQPA